VFDADGNAAEQALTADDKGRTVGGSADCPADAQSSCKPEAAYIGFRSVRGASKAPTAATPTTRAETSASKE
jgi:hypothetical protein